MGRASPLEAERCIAQTVRLTRCPFRGCIPAGLGQWVCLCHSARGYIPFAPDATDPRVEMRARAVMEDA